MKIYIYNILTKEKLFLNAQNIKKIYEKYMENIWKICEKYILIWMIHEKYIQMHEKYIGKIYEYMKNTEKTWKTWKPDIKYTGNLWKMYRNNILIFGGKKEKIH